MGKDSGTHWIVQFFLLLLFLACLPVFAAVETNKIVHLQIQKENQSCRLIFDATGPIDYRESAITNPNRIVLDITQMKLATSVHLQLLKNTPVNNIRMGIHKNKKLRIVLDIKHKVNARIFTIKPSSTNPYYRLVIALSWKKSAISEPVANSIAKKPTYQAAFHGLPSKKEPHHPVQEAPTANRLQQVVIVIDPGHGGKDPGAIGQLRGHEKDIVLAIARNLERDINRQPGFKAYLTRTDDYYLTLRQRLAIARYYKADMFVAIHADAYRNYHAHGVSVFALSQRGATSEAAHWLAKRENESELMGGVDLSDKNNLLKSVLIDLSQTATIGASLKIGDRIINTLGDVGHLHRYRVEQAAFVVLKSPDIPSLLVETGFISNLGEERNLQTRHYQEKIAFAIMQGIRSYFVDSPPRDTWLAAQKFGQGKRF